MSTDQLLLSLFIALLGAFGTMVGYMIRRIHDKLTELEKAKSESISRTEANALIDNKLLPLQQRIDNIDNKLDRIISLMLKKR